MAETNHLTGRFMDALKAAEETGGLDELLPLFADDAALGKLGVDHDDLGPGGAERFWRGYLDAFGDVRSTFRNVIEADGAASLEWVSEGTLPDGRPIRYHGVSLLAFDGDAIRRFQTYYDSAALAGPIAAAAADGGPDH
jgi:ketosteroid isomerase-like protein